MAAKSQLYSANPARSLPEVGRYRDCFIITYVHVDCTTSIHVCEANVNKRERESYEHKHLRLETSKGVVIPVRKKQSD